MQRDHPTYRAHHLSHPVLVPVSLHTPTQSSGAGAGKGASSTAASGSLARSGRLSPGRGKAGATSRKPVVQKLDAAQLEELKEAFSLFDGDNSGEPWPQFRQWARRGPTETRRLAERKAD